MIKKMTAIALTALLTSCSYLSVHKTPIEQGNVLSDKSMASIHKGMSQSAVVRKLGQPVLTNVFTPDMKAYVYTYQDGNTRNMKKKTLVVTFKSGVVSDIERVS